MLNALSTLTLLISFLFVNHIFTSQDLTTFHSYTQLSDDLRISVIKKMDLQTVMNLAKTSISQRNLIKYYLDNKLLCCSLAPTTMKNISLIFNPSDNSNNKNKRKRIEPTEGLMRLKKTNRKFWTDMSEESASFSNPDAEEDTTVRTLQLLFKKNEDESNC